jgi:hypothetical protein
VRRMMRDDVFHRMVTLHRMYEPFGDRIGRPVRDARDICDDAMLGGNERRNRKNLYRCTTACDTPGRRQLTGVRHARWGRDSVA